MSPSVSDRKVAGGVLTAKQAPAGPAPLQRSVCAPGRCPFIVSQTSSRKEKHHVVHFLAAKLETFGAKRAPRTQTSPRRRASFRPRPEALEDRRLLSGYQQTNLVSYEAGIAHVTDANLNGWGMASMPDGSFVVANPFSTGLATFYSSSGHVLPQTITVPASAAQPFGPVGEPTGVVYNPTSDFVISENGKSAPARLIFDTLDGTISGWNPAVDPTHAIVMVDNGAAGDLYTGLAMARNSQGQNVLYATDFGKNRVEMFNGDFKAIGSFTDPTVTSIDASLGAWSVQTVNNKLYVTFASLKDFDSGVVDVFDTDGHLLTPHHFAANGPGAGPLQNPWGIVEAPPNFGAYSNDLLIGNVAGAGNINVFNPKTGAYLGQLDQPDGTPIAITGLWELEFGGGTWHGGNTSELFFDAGPNAPGVSGYGLFGAIRATGDQGGKCGGDPVALGGGPIAARAAYAHWAAITAGCAVCSLHRWHRCRFGPDHHRHSAELAH